MTSYMSVLYLVWIIKKDGASMNNPEWKRKSYAWTMHGKEPDTVTYGPNVMFRAVECLLNLSVYWRSCPVR